MMIKANFTIVFILLANIFLLAHVFITHHHHGSDICFADSHCNSESHENEQDKNQHELQHELQHERQHERQHEHQHEHQHDRNHAGESGFCILNQINAIPENQSKLDSDNPNQYIYLNTTVSDHILLNDIDLKSIKQKGFLVAHHPLIFPFQSIFLTRSLNLRAPPVV